jgi:hypothetical protein
MSPESRTLIVTREKALQDRREAMIVNISRLNRRRITAMFLTVAIPILILMIYANVPFERDAGVDSRIFAFVNGLVPAIFTINYTVRLRSLRGELVDIDNQLDLIRIPDQSQEQKAQKLLQIQQLELKRYYDQTLSQSKGIFYVGVATMVLGFGIIGWSMYFVTTFETSGGQKWSDANIIVAVLGAIGGILTNFISAMYIKMFSEIVRSATQSHESLVITSHLHLANLLVANIRSDELREKTLSDLALGLKSPVVETMTSAAAQASGAGR